MHAGNITQVARTTCDSQHLRNLARCLCASAYLSVYTRVRQCLFLYVSMSVFVSGSVYVYVYVCVVSMPVYVQLCLCLYLRLFVTIPISGFVPVSRLNVFFEHLP